MSSLLAHHAGTSPLFGLPFVVVSDWMMVS